MASNDYIVDTIDRVDAESALFVHGFEKTIMILRDVIETTSQLPTKPIPSTKARLAPTFPPSRPHLHISDAPL